MVNGTRPRRTGPQSTRSRLRAVNAFTCWILRMPLLRRLADHQVIELRFTGARTGKPVVLPVMYAQSDDVLVVLVGGADQKRWWRNFVRPRPVGVRLRGAARRGIGQVLEPGAAGRAEAATVYSARFPDIPVRDDPLVVLTLDPEGDEVPSDAGPSVPRTSLADGTNGPGSPPPAG
jgi:hypothetical protein